MPDGEDGLGKRAKEADDEVVDGKTGAKARMARMDWPKPLHESGRSLFGVSKRRLARIDWAKGVEMGFDEAGMVEEINSFAT